MPTGNELFNIVNNWLGWGDPMNGLWFIGMEEGAIFDASVLERKGKEFSPVTEGSNLSWPVATTTAKVVAKLQGIHDHVVYRDSILWRDGSGVFNGNLLPLGKPKRTDWPEHYKDLFGIGYSDYVGYLQKELKDRFFKFKEFRRRMEPQAIVCFGKEFWPYYEEIFIENSGNKRIDESGVVVFENDKVILTGHFSYGRWMPNKAVDFVAGVLSLWSVTLEMIPRRKQNAT